MIIMLIRFRLYESPYNTKMYLRNSLLFGSEGFLEWRNNFVLVKYSVGETVKGVFSGPCFGTSGLSQTDHENRNVKKKGGT